MSEIVVITGAASGIGLELSRAYKKDGATVVGLDISTEALATFDGPSYKVDVSNEEQLLGTAQKISIDIGKPDIWINNAGIAAVGAFESTPSAEFNKVVSVNFNGVVYGTRAALSVMKQPSRGLIVNISSVSGFVPAPYLTSYVAAKHAVVGFTRALRQELMHAHSPVKLALVCPGFVKTQIMQSNPDFVFPQWLDFLVDDATRVAKEIHHDLKKGKLEIYPTINGKMMLKLHRFSPSLAERSSRLLVAKNWKQILGLSPIKK